MQSLAWSTVVILVLLLPGFFFFVGLYAPERFARDLAPRNPLGALAWTVLVSYLTHVLLSLGAGFFGSTVTWSEALDAMLLSAPSTPNAGGGASRVLSYSVNGSLGVPGYVLLSCAVGWSVGWLAGKGAAAGMLPALLQHSWVYDKRGPGGKLTYAHVLSDIQHQGKLVLYKGRLRYFGLNADGTLSYIVLLATEHRFLRLEQPVPATGRSRLIGRVSRAESAPADTDGPGSRQWMIPFRRSSSAAKPHKGIDGTDSVLVISGPLHQERHLSGILQHGAANHAVRTPTPARLRGGDTGRQRGKPVPKGPGLRSPAAGRSSARALDDQCRNPDMPSGSGVQAGLGRRDCRP